ncbi:hypothetical protein HMPREF9103_02986 [Lentilactobacillus parafarraginis F0439]|uniref:Uncharacterized protein n=1 Tax=Lentilactobacillus parafarraginis F0439 TaxID=797515 RepID=G9ZTA1_9LACO|nr:hypothetical protein HMPREF9103_02986 [Lentilactobacillus parafarraginis F0439]
MLNCGDQSLAPLKNFAEIWTREIRISKKVSFQNTLEANLFYPLLFRQKTVIQSPAAT